MTDTEARDRLAAMANDLRAYFLERGWSIRMDRRPGQPLHPFEHLATFLAAIPAATDEGLRAALDAALVTLTAGDHVFPGERLTARDLAVFQMTIGWLRRNLADRVAALAAEGEGS